MQVCKLYTYISNVLSYNFHGSVYKINVSAYKSNTGLRPTDAFMYMSETAGGQENVEHLLKDQLNYITRKRMKEMGGADAQNVLNLLKFRQEEDPMFYFSPKLDEDGRLCGLFWRDSMMRDDYMLYGDVMIFDTTYRTNKYGLICAPFVGLNNHWNNVMFGCAFISNEKTETFVWLLEEFLTSMDNKKPETIFTDQDFAIAKSIEMVLCFVLYKYCS